MMHVNGTINYNNPFHNLLKMNYEKIFTNFDETIQWLANLIGNDNLIWFLATNSERTNVKKAK